MWASTSLSRFASNKCIPISITCLIGFAACPAWAYAFGGSVVVGTAARAAIGEVWVTDKVISEGAEHDYYAHLPRIVRCPNGTFLVNWGTQALTGDSWWGHSAQFDLNGNRLRKLIEFAPTGDISFREPLACDLSPDSSILGYAWGMLNYADTPVYPRSCWFWMLDYATGSAIIPQTELDSLADSNFAAIVSNQAIEFTSDSSAIIYWSEQSSDRPSYNYRWVQRISSSGVLLGSRVDISPTSWYSCDTTDTCETIAERIRFACTNAGSLIAAYDAAGYVGRDIENVYSVGRQLTAALTFEENADILMCDSYPCPVFTGFWGVSQFVDIDAFPDGGFAIAANIGYDVDYTNLPAGRAFDSLSHPSSPVMGASDHFPGIVAFWPKVACGPNGEYVVVWSDRGENGNAYVDFWAQKFTRTGQAIGVNQRLNGRIDLGGGNSGSYDAAFINGHLVVTHYGLGEPFGIVGRPIYLQVMPWGKVGYYSPGDFDQSGEITSWDIILNVNYIFKSGSPAKPRAIAADVTGDCKITATDIIYCVNYVFKAGPIPANNCMPTVPYIP